MQPLQTLRTNKSLLLSIRNTRSQHFYLLSCNCIFSSSLKRLAIVVMLRDVTIYLDISTIRPVEPNSKLKRFSSKNVPMYKVLFVNHMIIKLFLLNFICIRKYTYVYRKSVMKYLSC